MLTLKMRLKGCPRCGGDLMPDRSDPAANTYACLQCGRDFSAAAIAMSPTQRLIPHATPAPVAA
jgi:ribosomal protein S27AE